MSGLFAESKQESLYKRLDQVKKGTRPISSGLIKDLMGFISKSTSTIPPMFNAALNGDGSATAAVNQLGDWETFLMSAYRDENNLPYRNAYLLAIERACEAPQVLVNEGRFDEAAQLLSDDQLLGKFLWPEALTIFKSVSTAAQLLPLQASISLEVLLSYVAAWDVELGMPKSQLIDILPSPDMPGYNPDKRLFRWLKEMVGVKSINSMLEDKRASKMTIEASTLKRWSCGKHHPSHDQWAEIVTAYFDESDFDQAWFRYRGAAYLNIIGWISQRLYQETTKLTGNDSLLPWPRFPFEHASIESWCQDRYFHWYDYHNKCCLKGGA